MKEDEKFICIRQFMRQFGISVATVYRIIKRKELPAFKVGNKWLIRQSDVDCWIQKKIKENSYQDTSKK